MAIFMDRRMNASSLDPVKQNINLTLPDGSIQTISLATVDANNAIQSCRSIAYGAEIGASITMLVVILTMTPKTKFWRFITFLNIAALCNNIIRVMLLAVYFQSSWVTTYTLYTGDLTYVTTTDVANTVGSTVMSIPQNIMIMTALILQAWAMVKLWPRAYKWAVFGVSLFLVGLEVGFMAATEAYQITYELPWESPEIMLSHLWVRYVFLALEVTCTCWFCFLFNFKLVVHLWKHRSFLPPSKGLSAMDALVMTNGVLMLIPVIFAALQYSSDARFEAGSMVYTSVIIVLPLGTLVAQRIADPAAFSNGELSAATTRMGNHPNDRFGRFTAGGGGGDTSAKRFLINNSNSPTWSQSDKEGAVLSRGKTGVTSTVTSGKCTKNVYHASTGEPMSAVDIELARIDADLEAGVVRVNHEIQQGEEVL